MNKVYLDNAATTRVKDEVLAAMLPYYQEAYGNPSSVYALGRAARGAVERAREQVAAALSADTSEIYFTGGGTEADNWLIKGIAAANRERGAHIITSAIEHHAVLHTCEQLEKYGFTVTYLPVDEHGLVQPETLARAMTDGTTLVTVMLANNEIGTIQPIAELSAIAHARGALFHTDAVQAIGAMPVRASELGFDALSLTAHKIYGPKGVGAAFVRKGVRIEAHQVGGAQERSKRGGTENVAGIVGLGKAIEMATADTGNARTLALRDRLIDGIESLVPHTRLNGHRTRRLPGNVNFSFRYAEGEALLLSLDMEGIAASSGSACTSGSLDPSHVLLAIGLSHEIAHGSVRLSIGDFNTDEDIDFLLDKLPRIVQKLRNMSPLYDQAAGGENHV